MKPKSKILAFLTLSLLITMSFTNCNNAGMNGNSQGEDDIFVGIPYRDLVSVPGGEFNQISAVAGLPNFDHELSAFKIAQYQVTYELWHKVKQWAEDNGYTFANSGREGSNGTDGDPPTAAEHEPVTWISWRDAIVWCNAYSEMAGLTPVYTYNSDTIKDSSDSNACDNAVENWTTANGYRLPSEGEWEYAARWEGANPSVDAVEFPAGSGNFWTKWNYASGAAADYNNEDATKAVAWYDANSDTGSGKKTQIIGTRDPNALDIFDMSGNVFEWCWDLKADYPGSSEVNYRGPDSGTMRVMRGGSYHNEKKFLRVCHRAQQNPYAELATIGFRVARSE